MAVQKHMVKLHARAGIVTLHLGDDEHAVQADGTEQWRRRIATANPGAWDGLDYRFSRSVPVGRALRVTVAVSCQGARRRSLAIEADEIV